MIDCSDIQQHDVLLGQGAMCACHIGSIALKVIVASRMEAYLKAPSDKAKTLITWDIVDNVQLTGSRFLTKKLGGLEVANSSATVKIDSWFEINKVEARIKVLQMCRDVIKSTQKMGHASLLLDELGLSNTHFDVSTPFVEIVEYLAKSTKIRDYTRTQGYRVGKRKRSCSSTFYSKSADNVAFSRSDIKCSINADVASCRFGSIHDQPLFEDLLVAPSPSSPYNATNKKHKTSFSTTKAAWVSSLRDIFPAKPFMSFQTSPPSTETLPQGGGGRLTMNEEETPIEGVLRGISNLVHTGSYMFTPAFSQQNKLFGINECDLVNMQQSFQPSQKQQHISCSARDENITEHRIEMPPISKSEMTSEDHDNEFALQCASFPYSLSAKDCSFSQQLNTLTYKQEDATQEQLVFSRSCQPQTQPHSAPCFLGTPEYCENDCSSDEAIWKELIVSLLEHPTMRSDDDVDIIAPNLF